MTAGVPHSQIKGGDQLVGRVAEALVAAYPARLVRIDAGTAIGVSGRVTCALASGRPVAIDPWLAWCARLGLDPVTGKRAGKGIPTFSQGEFLWWYFGAGVIGSRMVRNWSLDVLASRTGLSKATLSRMESATPVSVASVAAVCRGLDLHPHGYCSPLPFRVAPPVARVSRQTPTETRGNHSTSPNEAVE